jgi:hypothetical protein
VSQLVIGPAGVPIPLTVYAPIVETSATGNGSDWTLDNDLSMVSCGCFASSTKVSTCEIDRKYGNTKYPMETAFSSRSARDMTGTWIRLSMIGNQGSQVQFVGIIADQSQELQGDGAQPGGDQRWVAYGGLYVLQKLELTKSMFQNADNSNSEVGWLAGMNRKDKRGLIVGNANSAGTFFGGTTVWTHLQFLNYLVTNYIQQKSGPTWTVTGQSDVLGQMKTSVDFGEKMNAAEMLRQIIPVKYGVDFQIVPTTGGFAINIFALSGQALTFAASGGSVTMPSNPNTVKVERENQIDLVDCRIVESDFKRYDKIQVIGKRIVVCGTLRGARVASNTPVATPGDPSGATLVPKWPDALETDYISAGGDVTANPDDGPEIWDKIRQREKYREVYQHFGAPKTWDLDDGDWAVSCNDDGSQTTDVYQTTVRETLNWIPLQEGFDYSTNPPTDNSLDDQEQEAVKPPLAWIYDESPDLATPRFVQCELVGMSVHHPYQDWGVMIHNDPNHRIALNAWTTEQLATTDLIDQDFDFDTLVATIAIESDHRISLTYSLPANLAAGDGSVMPIYDDEAELWILLGQTILDVDTTGNLIASGAQQTTRDDTSRLALVMAGAVGRYTNQRVRVELQFKGYQPWSQILGYILTVVQQGDTVTTVGSPITSIEFTSSPPSTVIKTGYA